MKRTGNDKVINFIVAPEQRGVRCDIVKGRGIMVSEDAADTAGFLACDLVFSLRDRQEEEEGGEAGCFAYPAPFAEEKREYAYSDTLDSKIMIAGQIVAPVSVAPIFLRAASITMNSDGISRRIGEDPFWLKGSIKINAVAGGEGVSFQIDVRGRPELQYV